MKLKIAIYSFVLLLSMILLNNCTASMLGVPDTFKGYYQSVITVLDDKTYLFFRVSAGGFWAMTEQPILKEQNTLQ